MVVEKSSRVLARPSELETSFRTVRDETLLQFRRHLSAVLSRQAGQVAALCGEVGSGKTFALESLLKHAPCKYLHVSASSSDLDIIQLLPKLEFSSKTQLPRSQQARLETLAKQLCSLAPFILVLENLHELSSEKLEFIKQLASIIPKLRGVGLFVTSRSEVPSSFKRYWLEPLSQQEITALLEGQAKAKLPEEGLEWVFAKSQGNPLFALEFWRYLSQQGYFWSDGSRWHWRTAPKDFVPPTVRAILHEWVYQVAKDDVSKRVLEVRALLPETIHEEVWAEVAELEPPLLRDLQHYLENAGILREGKFVHPLVTQMIREDIAIKERTLYAGRALLALENAGLEPSVTLLGYAKDTCKSLQIYERLASNAKNKNDFARAGHWLALASEGSSGQKQIHLALEAAQLLRHSDLSRALELAQRAVHAPPHTPEAVYLCAELWATQGNTPEAETVLDLLRPQERESQRWWETLIKIHYTSHADYAEVLQLWELRPDFHRYASPETVVYVCAVLGQRGQFKEAFALSQPLLEGKTLEPYLRCRLLEMEATFYSLQGQMNEAARQNAAAIAIARTLDRPDYLAHLLRKEGIYAENQGRFRYTITCYREALQLLSEHGSPLDRASLESILASSLANQGDYEEAETLLLRALSVLEQSDNKLLHCDCRVGLTWLYLDWQPRYAKTMALRHARLALELAQKLGNQQMLYSSLTTLALAEAYAGNGQRATKLARESFDEQYTASSPIRKGHSLYALGMALEATGERDEAISKLSECVGLHLELGLTSSAHRFGLELDRITKNAAGAGERRSWFEAQGLLGSAMIAARYFPQQIADVASATSVPRLCLLGPASLETREKTSPYRGRKRLELLTYLLETRIVGKPEATFLELMDALYPETDELGAKAILKQLVYLLRNQLGSQAIHSTASGYALGELETDVEVFLKRGDSELVRGAYLDGSCAGWYPEAHEQFLDRLKEVALGKLESNPNETLRLAEVWQRMEPYDAQGLSLSLRALQRLGDARKLERLYQQGVQRFKEVGETLPATSEKFLESLTKV
jgi:tetratricopeptide (TPR) repeat protein